MKLGRFIVQPVLLEEDEEGEVTGEVAADAQVVYGVAGLHAFADGFPAALKQFEAERAKPKRQAKRAKS